MPLKLDQALALGREISISIDGSIAIGGLEEPFEMEVTPSGVIIAGAHQQTFSTWPDQCAVKEAKRRGKALTVRKVIELLEAMPPDSIVRIPYPSPAGNWCDVNSVDANDDGTVDIDTE